jgi:hypothetical protein
VNETVSGIIQLMRAVAPPGRPHLDEATARRLRELTRELIAAKPDATGEHDRFLAIRDRGLTLPTAHKAELAGRLRHATILVTGGTGCIGTVLMARLAQWCPGRLVSVSRGVTRGAPPRDGVEYVHADIRDRRAVGRLVAEIRPDVIFHLAAQRDPGLAEVEVHRTVTTNVLGTRNVLAAAAAAGVPQVVCASTGKALRPYSPDVYTASKRAAEWVAAATVADGDLLCSAARFTHVVDNSIIYRRLRSWAAGPRDTPIRLHGTSIAFYAQSALESAQLLLFAFLGARPGEFRVHAITDLGWPVCLIDLALGVLAETDAHVPIYFSGYDAGYEQVPFPGLYDPLTAGDVSPLLNAYEAVNLVSPAMPGADGFRLPFAADPRLHKLLSRLDDASARTHDPAPLRQELDELSWALLGATLRTTPREALLRSAARAKAHWDTMSPEHRGILETICDIAGNP